MYEVGLWGFSSTGEVMGFIPGQLIKHFREVMPLYREGFFMNLGFGHGLGFGHVRRAFPAIFARAKELDELKNLF